MKASESVADGLPGGAQLPDISASIPSNAEVVTHPNSCYDWGTIGWLLESGRVDTRQYRHFLFMNSSVRGPYIPTFSQVLRPLLGDCVRPPRPPAWMLLLRLVPQSLACDTFRVDAPLLCFSVSTRAACTLFYIS